MKQHKSLLAMAREGIIRDDRGENSIMQVISIAVSAILIVAGLVTAPSLIQSARNTNASNDLANLAYVEEYASSNGGGYMPLTDKTTYDALVAATQDNASGSSAKLTLTSGGKVSVVPSAAHGGYVAVVGTASPAGVPRKWFARTGDSTKIVVVDSTGSAEPTAAQVTAAISGAPAMTFYQVP